MKFTVKLYALLAAYVPGTRAAAPFEVELPEGSTIADLIQHLQIPPEEMKIAFVNGRMQPLEYLIQEGDEVGMFSPVGGGSEEEMHLDIWLYGDLARRGGREAPLGYAHLELAMPVGSRMQQLLDPGGWGPGCAFSSQQHVAIPVPSRCSHDPGDEKCPRQPGGWRLAARL